MHPIDQQNEFKGRQSGSSMRNEHLTVPTGIGANMDGDQFVMYNNAIGQGNAPSRTQTKSRSLANKVPDGDEELRELKFK